MKSIKTLTARASAFVLALLVSVASFPALTANAEGLSEIAIAKWNTSQPGVIIASFVPISSTGDSYGLNYVMQLYKDGNLIDTKENKQSSVDMSEIIGNHGYGKYIFKVKAVEFDYSTNEPTGNETQFKESDELDYKPFEGEKTGAVALIVPRDSSVFKNGSGDITPEGVKYNAKIDVNSTTSSLNGVYYNGHAYEAKITLGFCLNDGLFESSDKLNVTVNGEPATVESSSGMKAIVKYTFPQVKSNTSIILGEQSLNTSDLGKAISIGGGTAILQNGSTDNGFTLTLNNVNLTVGTKEFPTSDIDENKKRISIERTFGITTNRDLKIVLKGKNTIGSLSAPAYYGILSEEDSNITFSGDGILDIYSGNENGGFGISTADNFCGIMLNSGTVNIHSSGFAYGLAVYSLDQLGGTLSIDCETGTALKLANGGNFTIENGNASFLTNQTAVSGAAVDYEKAYIIVNNGSLTAQSLTNGYGMFGYGGSFTYIGGYVGFAGVTGAASGDYNIKNKPGVFTSNQPDLTTVKYGKFADALFKDKTIKAGILKPIERIDFIDIGNIWNALEVDNTVPFTAELNPNSDCPKKLEILNEGWIDNDTNETLADKSGNYTGTPVAARTYKHFIDIAIKGDNRFFADKISYIYGGKEASPLVYTLSDSTIRLFNLVKPVTLPPDSSKVISKIEINNAALSFKIEEKPKFTASVPKKYSAIYALDLEYIGEYDDRNVKSFITSNPEENIETDTQKLITVFKKGISYNYGVSVYLKETAYEAGYRFDVNNISLFINGKEYKLNNDRSYIDDALLFLSCKDPMNIEQCLHKNTTTVGAVTATCSKKGYTGDKKCKDCGAVIKKGSVIISNIHKTKTVVQKATKTKDGKVSEVCTVCKKTVSTAVIHKIAKVSLSETKYVYKKEHSPEIKVIDSKGRKLKIGKDYTVSGKTKGKAIGKYRMTVKFKGNYDGKVNLSFTIVPSKLKITSKKSNGKGRLVVSYTTLRYVSGYEVQYSLNKNFKKAKSTKLSSRSKYCTIRNLKSGKKYYVRVRAFKKVGNTKYYGDWSTAKNNKVK